MTARETRDRALQEFARQEGIPSHLTLLDGLRWWFERRGLNDVQAEYAMALAGHARVPGSPEKIREQLTRFAESATK